MKRPASLFRVALVAPPVHVAEPQKNVDQMIRMLDQVEADIVVFPELAITGYTCGDLFATDALVNESVAHLLRLANHSAKRTIIVGVPLVVAGSLMNVAAVLSDQKIVGIVPKSFLPNYREFYEARHFKPATGSDPNSVAVGNFEVAFGTDLLFRVGEATIAIEICEDFWTPIPPSSHAALAGADVLVNLSASNETIGKADWRRDLVRSQSGRCMAAYAYVSSGPSESTSDLVFGGHGLIAENGSILAESRAVGEGTVVMNGTVTIADVDLARLKHDRRVTGSFDDAREERHRGYRTITVQTSDTATHRRDLLRTVDATPFVPKDAGELGRRCGEIFDLQTAGLIKRLTRLPKDIRLTIGVSGGLDSTLALLVAVRACDCIGKPRTDILGLTMPGFGTTDHTKNSSDRLIEATKITGKSIDIRQLCLDTFLSMHHKPMGINIDSKTTVEKLQELLNQTPDGQSDLTFENVQARIRTMLLMNCGFTLGTGDMSEQALGWCTYNADHMSMYNVNTSVPKTLVQFLIRHWAQHDSSASLREVLMRIADTPISPELLPPSADGSIRQNTEATIGSYELHDFFLYHFVRHGADQEKILFLASHADFQSTRDMTVIEKTLATFMKRFFANQFKRNCVPDGPKVGSVSLSPRGDWRMPSDAG
jgi:NAD+ synthase (glutamine-hydrolysing)